MAELRIVSDAGVVMGAVKMGDLPDADLLVILKTAAIGMKVAKEDTTPQELAQIIVEYLNQKLRNIVRNWYVDQEKNRIEQEAQLRGESLFDSA